MKKTKGLAINMKNIGGFLLALGALVCLLPHRSTFSVGIVLGCIGIVMLWANEIILSNSDSQAPIKLSMKLIVATFMGIIGAVLFGIGMCLTIVWSSIAFGILVGITGLLLLISLAPLLNA